MSNSSRMSRIRTTPTARFCVPPASMKLPWGDRKSTRLNSNHGYISYAVFCLKKKKYHRVLNGIDSLLFGTFLGLTSRKMTVVLAVGAVGVIDVVFAARPVMFASVDDEATAGA